MPESQVSNVKAHQIHNDLGDEYKGSGFWPEGHLEIFPRTFSVGTDAKSYTTLSVDRGDYQDSQEPLFRVLNPWDAARIPDRADWGYLAKKQLDSGPVHVAVRGKCLVFSAGYHAIICHLGLEGNITSMSIEDYQLLVAQCIPGSNDDSEKAEKMRSFLLPPQFREPGARSQETATVNVLAAIVTERNAFVITDFNRLTRLHVVSAARKFTSRRSAPTIIGGPDWVSEREDALAYLDQWRVHVLQKKVKTCIVDVLTSSKGPGGGIGKQLASDLLYEVAIHPDTPSLFLCQHDVLYDRLRAHLPVFMMTWVSPPFLNRCGGRTNSLNPFAFNTKSNRNFLAGYVKVYRRREVRIPRDLYNFYFSTGLFDPDHIIGEPYLKEVTLITAQCKEVQVHCFSATKSNRYHVILAQVPKGWQDPTFTDVSNAGFATTLCVASFKEPMQNKMDLEQAKSLARRGRPPKAVLAAPGKL
ncbi:hypothetical protein FB451DRAFT_1364625 [Mycena latifolia]|nr:hypothetical protein FB451DRAFT_1364625 [Mycena latifolia]